jgi:class 3 adenylate cyclase
MATKRRKLAAILSADIVGFSRLMEDDETDTVRSLKAYRALFSGEVDRFRGRIVNMPGDALLAEFASAIDAVECAASVQRLLTQQNAERAPHRRSGAASA